ncbi:MAG: RNA polymerase sigma factor [Muricoprocola sp.]
MTTEEIKSGIHLYGKDIYSFCCYLAKNKTEADDLYQDVFLKALELKDRILHEENLKNYLLSIAIKLWKNHCRKSWWRQKIAPEESIEANDTLEVKDTVSGPEEQLLQEEQRQVLLKSLNALSDPYRIPIYLYYLNGLSQAEIAECMNLPIGTIKSRIYKAKRLLKEELEAQGYDR